MKRMSLTLILTLTLALTLATIPACGGDEGSTDSASTDTAGEAEDPAWELEEHACHHFEEGPALAVTAADAAGTPPDVSEAHTRYDVTMTTVDGGQGGSLVYVADEAGERALLLSADVPVQVVDAAGDDVTLTRATPTGACASIAVRYDFEVGIGTLTLTLGPTDETSVSLVLAHLDHDEHDDE